MALLKKCLSILDTEKYPQVRTCHPFDISYDLNIYSINQVATAALYYLMDLYLPSSLNIPNMEEDSEVEQESWDYEWEENELADQFS